MPLIQATLKAQIKKLSKEMLVYEDSDKALDHFANELATIITNHIKTATVTVTPGQLVQTVPVTGTGTTTTPGTGTLS